jgi:SNF2 family DNA or RNA helicase
MLKVRYSTADQLAELSVEEPTAAWSAIRRTCEDRSEEVVNESGTSFTIPWWAFLSCRGAVGLILRQYEMGVEFDLTARRLIEEARDREKSYREVPVAGPSSEAEVAASLQTVGFSRRLTDEQLRNVSKLIRLPSGATFSVPGAGKTTEALAYFLLRRSSESRLLVVAPKNAFAAWEEQLALCYPGTPTQFVRLQGGVGPIARTLSSHPALALITYHQLPNVLDLIARYLSGNPSFMFVDESHRMKRGNEGVIASAILNISHVPAFKLILSGTPMPNSMADLVPQFDFLYPEVRATEADVRELIRPIYVRTTKGELRLPPIRRARILIPMSPAQQRLYELLKSEIAREMAEIRSVDRIALRTIGTSVMRLLQLTSNPALLAQADFEQPELMQEILSEGGSPKMEYACNRVRKLAQQGQKAVVWSSFVGNVEILAQRLADLGAVFIHGGVEAGSDEDEDTREYRIRKFHEDPKTMVLVGNPAACGEGISLHTICHNAIYVDRNYNAAQYLQSEDRIHRLGLPADVDTFVEILCSPGSIDESVDRRLIAKTDQMARVLNDRSLNIEPVSVDPDDLSMGDQDVQDFLRHLTD